MPLAILTLDDLELADKTVFVRVDINVPIDPQNGKILETSRIAEATITLKDLTSSKVVVASHQGRIGRYDYVSLEQHAEVLNRYLGRDVKFIDDVFGPKAREEISSLKNGGVLLLDNLRFAAEENAEFPPEKAAQTFLVQRLYKLFDACVLDAFPTAHRSHPSIVGFSQLLPTCAGRLVAKELKALSKISAIAKGPYTTVLGGAKVSDRLEAIDSLIANQRADKVLLTGLIASVFFKASGKITKPLGIEGEDKYVSKARSLLAAHPEVFELPLDVAIEKDGERVEVDSTELYKVDRFLDIGSKTISYYSKLIRSSGTVFMSGPPGMFEKEGFEKGTEELLRAMASSMGLTIVSGGHLNAALERFGIKEWIDHVSTAGGALVMYLAGKKLPLLEALEQAAMRMKSSG